MNAPARFEISELGLRLSRYSDRMVPRSRSTSDWAMVQPLGHVAQPVEGEIDLLVGGVVDIEAERRAVQARLCVLIAAEPDADLLEAGQE